MVLRSSRGRPLNAPAAFIHPCQPIVAKQPPSGPGWAHELKHDGYRLQIHVRDGRVHLYTIDGADWSKRYPLIVDAAAHIKGTAILDAEVVWIGLDGVPGFGALHSRVNDKSASAWAFDVLMVNGDDLRRKPYAERKSALRKLLRHGRGIQYVEHAEGHGDKLLPPPVVSGWRELFQRSSTRPIARDRRKPGSRSRIRRHPLPRGDWMGRSDSDPKLTD